MNLFRDTGMAVRWLASLVSVFFRLRPLTTMVVVAASALSRVTTVLAFVLPLKVILLVASDGIPHYFQALVAPEQKDALIVVLVAAAIFSIFASVLLDFLKSRLAASTSVAVIWGANRLAVFGDQYNEAQSVYARGCDIVSVVIFTLVGFAVIGLIDPYLVAALAGAMLLEYLITAAVLARLDPVHPQGVSGAIYRNPRGLLDALSAVNFLVAFAVLLYPFVWGQGGNVMLAVISVIILRRVLNPLAQTIAEAASLVEKRSTINALVYREHKYQQLEGKDVRGVRDVFHKTARQQRVTELLSSIGKEPTGLQVMWQDPAVPGINALLVYVDDGDERSVYQQQIFLPRQGHRLENEEILFSYVSRRQLPAPDFVTRSTEGPYECQLVTAGSGERVPHKSWLDVQLAVFEQCLAVAPPSDLIQAYAVSRLFLWDRLSDEMLGRLEMAVDTDEDRNCYRALLENMPLVRDLLRGMPLYIHNPEIVPPNVLLTRDDTAIVMTWGRWSLEPIGAGLPGPALNKSIDDIMGRLAAQRREVMECSNSHHMRLAGLCWNLEWQITRNLFRSGMATAASILESPALNQNFGRQEGLERVASVAKLGH